MKPEKVNWREFVERMKNMLKIHQPPHVVAGSFATAFMCGTAPFYVGVAAVVPLASVFGLNKVIAIGVTALLLANPFMIFVIPIQTWFGLFLMREPVPAWLLKLDPSGFIKEIGHSWKLLVAYALGGYASSIVLAGAVFAVLWPILEWRRRLKAEREGDAKGG